MPLSHARTYAMKRLSIALASVAILVGCGGQKPAEDAEKAQQEVKTPPEESPRAEPEGDQLSVSSETPVGGEHIAAEPAEPLTDEEKALIEKDPKDLTPEERRKRGYALRKKIMQDPDSARAQSILQGAKAIENGEMEVPAEFKTPAAEGSADPAPADPAPSK